MTHLRRSSKRIKLVKPTPKPTMAGPGIRSMTTNKDYVLVKDLQGGRDYLPKSKYGIVWSERFPRAEMASQRAKELDKMTAEEVKAITDREAAVLGEETPEGGGTE